MNKKLLTAIIVATLSITMLPTSKAEEVKPATLAIIDTALDTTIPAFRGKVIHEVCILDWNSCPNGKNFLEGPGSALMALPNLKMEGFDHGTQMVSAAIATNPNINIVFIRFVGASANGFRQITNETSFVNALNWVYQNKDRFNIKAIAMSQSHHNLGAGANYCPSTPNTESIISQLDSAGVTVFLPAGNMRDLKRISWPACIAASFAVSASGNGDSPAIYTNYDSVLTDIFARGDMKVYAPGGSMVNAAGTSISTQVAAASYIALANKYPSYTATQLKELLKTKTVPVVSRTIKNAKIVDPTAVLRG